MFRSATLGVAALAGTLLPGSLILGNLRAQLPQLPRPAEKDLLRGTLEQLLPALRPWTEDRRLSQIATAAMGDVRWFLNATERWRPERPEEGRGLRVSMDRMLGALRQRGTYTVRVAVVRNVCEDLDTKRQFCQRQGLSALQKVEVRTLENGRTEKGDLEVWYLEKFLELDPAAKGRRFRDFSSPAHAEVVPGRYLLWSHNPANDKSGRRVETRIDAGSGPVFKFAVLTP